MSTSNTPTATMTTTLGQSISEKLSGENYILWKAQVLAVVRGVRLHGYLDGLITAPSKIVQVQQSDKR
jgi:hypothetical protein